MDVYMGAWMDARMDGCINGCIEGRMDACIGWMYRLVHGRMHAWIGA